MGNILFQASNIELTNLKLLIIYNGKKINILNVVNSYELYYSDFNKMHDCMHTSI
jgi:hypothetical protein